jgi:hypothetical protein
VAAARAAVSRDKSGAPSAATPNRPPIRIRKRCRLSMRSSSSRSKRRLCHASNLLDFDTRPCTFRHVGCARARNGTRGRKARDLLSRTGSRDGVARGAQIQGCRRFGKCLRMLSV